MTRLFVLLLLTMGFVLAQKPAPAPAPAPPAVAEPAEEDETIKPPKEYEFNPLQAEKEIAAGKYYMKRGSAKGAAQRFEEAAKWNPQSGEAYVLLGEAREKMGEMKAAKAAYEKALEIVEGKQAAEVKKKLAKLKV